MAFPHDQVLVTKIVYQLQDILEGHHIIISKTKIKANWALVPLSPVQRRCNVHNVDLPEESSAHSVDMFTTLEQ